MGLFVLSTSCLSLSGDWGICVSLVAAVGLVALQAHTLCASAGYMDSLVAKTRWAEIQDTASKTRQV